MMRLAFHHSFFRPPKTPALPSKRNLFQHPPAVCRNASLTTTATILAPTPALSLPPPSPPTSAYIHLPFCRKRCHYCDFPIVALGTSTASPSPTPPATYDDDPRISNYIALVLREIQAANAKPHNSPPLQTVFFGGGTPSLVTPRLVSTILDTLRSKFGMRTDVEVSMEMDPGTFDAARLEDFLALGVNRVSLGVQAFQEELLRACGRAHGLREAREAIELVAGAAGVENWSMDIISSLPHQTMEMWEETLRLTVDARPSHVSVYDLQVEQGTKFGHLYTPGEFPLPSENQSAEFYKTASKRLGEAGYEHYEISSYCREGFQCKHNLVYWQNRPFYGFGLGAASYLNGTRFSRPRRMREYAAYVQKLEDGLADACTDADTGADQVKDKAMDVVMLSLRTARGLDLKSFAECFGQPAASLVCKAFEPYLESGHVVALDEKRMPLLKPDSEACGGPGSALAFLRLSDPDGFLLSNELISHAFAALSQ